jgi:hypothetical protein
MPDEETNMSKDWMDEFRERFRGGGPRDRRRLLVMALAFTQWQNAQQQQAAAGTTGVVPAQTTNPIFPMLPLLMGDMRPEDMLLFSVMANPGMDMSQMMPFFLVAMDWDRPCDWEAERGRGPFHTERKKVEIKEEEEEENPN